ncbi:Transposase [Oopsacas minuta]|uniref:Transposase n=1 Tax=Oopsacas minuta TaxID=111878 RepID=A0AAV7JI29_9METZ|nr:Transposase [Oopsacas minuta]
MASCPNFRNLNNERTSNFAPFSKSLQSIHNELATICGEDTLSYSTVRRWVSLFREGRTSVQDAPRPGAPKLVTNNDKLSEVKEYVESFPHSSVEEVANYVGISTRSAHTILKADLELRKIQVRWIPHCLTFPQKAARLQMAKENLEIYEGSDPRRLLEIVTGDETWIQFKPPIRKQDGRVWLKKGKVPPAVYVSDFRAPKVLYCIFFDGLGPVAQIPVPKGETLTGQFYADVVLPEVEKHYLKRRPKTGTRGLKILHDNARPHKSLAVRQKIKDMGMHEVPHPPYSPDIAPCDFWLLENSKITSPDVNLRIGSASVGQFTDTLKSFPRMSTERHLKIGLKG